MTYISQRLSSFGGTEFQEVFRKKASLENPIDLSVGITEDHTPYLIKAAGIQAIENNLTTYTPAHGIQPLREAIAQKLRNENNIAAEAHNISVTPGLTTGLLMVYMAILDPGDEVIVIDPYYPPYVDVANSIGAKAVTVPAGPGFQLDQTAIAAAITPRSRAIIINSPNNPTGAVYSRDSLVELAHIAGQHDLTIVSDEIYEYFSYDAEHFSVASIYPNTITMNGFSKSYAMTGWRLGYITGPSEAIDAINTLQQYIVFSSSSIAQHAALAALQNPLGLDVEKYHHKRNLAVSKLEQAGIEIQGADGAFYLFIDTPNGIDDLAFIEQAAQQNLIIVPGRAFSSSHNRIRISYGVDMETLEKGIDILVQLSSRG